MSLLKTVVSDQGSTTGGFCRAGLAYHHPPDSAGSSLRLQGALQGRLVKCKLNANPMPLFRFPLRDNQSRRVVVAVVGKRTRAVRTVGNATKAKRRSRARLYCLRRPCRKSDRLSHQILAGCFHQTAQITCCPSENLLATRAESMHNCTNTRALLLRPRCSEHS